MVYRKGTGVFLLLLVVLLAGSLQAAPRKYDGGFSLKYKKEPGFALKCGDLWNLSLMEKYVGKPAKTEKVQVVVGADGFYRECRSGEPGEPLAEKFVFEHRPPEFSAFSMLFSIEVTVLGGKIWRIVTDWSDWEPASGDTSLWFTMTPDYVEKYFGPPSRMEKGESEDVFQMVYEAKGEKAAPGETLHLVMEKLGKTPYVRGVLLSCAVGPAGKSGAAAAAGRRDPTLGDFQYGPFMCGDKWDPAVAQKTFGTPLGETKVPLVLVNRYDLQDGYRKATPDNSHNIRLHEGHEIRYRNIVFLVAGGVIQRMVVFGGDVPTARGLTIGDSLEKTVRLYGFLMPGAKAKTMQDELYAPAGDEAVKEELYPASNAGEGGLNYKIGILKRNEERQISFLQDLHITVDGASQRVVRMEFQRNISIMHTKTVFPSSPYLAELKNRTSGTGKLDQSMPETVLGPFRIGNTFHDATIQNAKKVFGTEHRKKESGKTEKGNILYQHLFYPPKSADPSFTNYIFVADDKIVGVYIDESIIDAFAKNYRGDMETGKGLACGDSVEKAVGLYGKPERVYTSSDGVEYSTYYYGTDKKGMELYFDEYDKRILIIFLFNYQDY